MCHLPNMQDSDLKEISQRKSTSRKRNEADLVSAFAATSPLLENFH